MKSEKTIRVALLVLDACNTLTFASAVDPMRAANRLSAHPVFDWQYLTAVGAPATLTSGIVVPGRAITSFTSCDLCLVLAGFDLDRHATPALLASLRRIAANGAAMGGIDGGPWILARAGLLDGHAATTHWEDLDRFAATFPDIDTVPDRYRIDDARLTSGGAMPAIDMMLDLIARRISPDLAAKVAAVFIHDTPSAPARPQSRSGDARHSPLTARAAKIMEQAIETPIKIPQLCARLGVGPRLLEQQFRARLGTTPHAHYLALRLAEAHRQVLQTDRPLFDIALATGFGSQASFARAFRAAFGTSARALRKAQ
ncbi:GlxA family transcriptional regulator [Thalassococcus sp. S3]|uniref:GlxA family transcriptional regulator n=1 Tax=Thalassococcus sp. S3 TaxID=2017482 RepID=UPI0010243226|nr:helix-turn-helix domain-containing protein [Thalassococcus sp. S3]QBF31155.1 AraC family transcriptional regulator [Thalassococcus sp. S3]